MYKILATIRQFIGLRGQNLFASTWLVQENSLDLRQGCAIFFCRWANFRLLENFVGQSKWVIHVVSTHK